MIIIDREIIDVVKEFIFLRSKPTMKEDAFLQVTDDSPCAGVQWQV